MTGSGAQPSADAAGAVSADISSDAAALIGAQALGSPGSNPATEAGSPEKVSDSSGSGEGAASLAEAEAAAQLQERSCEDLEDGCAGWAADDGCIHHGPSFMFERCRKSCGVCGQPSLTNVPVNVSSSLLPFLANTCDGQRLLCMRD